MALGFFSSLFGKNDRYLGIDIGTTSIKLVEVERGKGLPVLKNYGMLESYGYLERSNEVIQASSLKFYEKEVVALLNYLLSRMKPRSHQVIASLPSFLVFNTILELPLMSQEDTVKSMGYQARQYIPLPLTDVTLDWLKVGEREINGIRFQQIFLIAVTNEHVERYKSLFKKVGLKLVALESESLASIRSLALKDAVPTLIVDIGARSTNIAITEGGYLRFNSQTDFASFSLSQSIAQGLNITISRAEEMKRRHGLLGTGGDYELSTLMMSSLDAILSEIGRAMNEYEARYGNTLAVSGKRRLERIILTGGGAKLRGIEKYIEEQFGLPVVKVNPFSRLLFDEQMGPIIEEINSYFSVAIGLGIRQFL
ncbi:MAG: hypothetical protein A3A04_02375 [Candidatus Harrisonbacteria bacterium RIFCSPLOWO2_01_FULL_40_28]|uniref:SHS2 domain-containing protein n=1 Tax=Candidatus Harrisonbacteria bacterium RIFCSPLOWO2_01_FULL_40_28 TaxID=1798406 RepID=A0A1G1ZNP2_9BACT|nr:MAG: hypothetical protein A3A04_02375 [Candidatus Harrisonbacteria bacterium RIFCSPLOWO2_01_FULL_40_28]